jgi:phosphatidylinositol kinase/protein kinase (PI-3  family)
MRVLRDNRDSVMAMLEAFVYDPLISWRLLTRRENDTTLDPVPLSRAVGMYTLHIVIHLIVPVPLLFANYRQFC